MRLSYLAWLHNAIYLGAFLFAIYLGTVSAYAEITAYQRGQKDGEERGEMQATAKYIHRLSLKELSELDI